jgi:hypothetical protein
MVRVTVYLKSGAVAEFEARQVTEAAEAVHPKFRLEFPAPENGGRRLVYLDRDDVSAVVVEEEHDAGNVLREVQAVVALPAERQLGETDAEAMTVSVSELAGSNRS